MKNMMIKIITLLIFSIVRPTRLILSLFARKIVELSFSSKAKDEPSFILNILLTLATVFIYLCISTYYSEPIYCSSPNIMQNIGEVHSAGNLENTSHSWDELWHSLKNAMDHELDRRGRANITSSSVTLRDLGIGFNRHRGPVGFENHPGLTALFESNPEIFVKKGATKITHILASLHTLNVS
jgi:hypothetical protein